MIKRLKRRLILITMSSFLLVLIAVVGSINIANYRRAIHDADRVLDIISRFDGILPEEADPNAGALWPEYSSPEEPYESRYFSVLLDENGDLISSNTGQIAAVDSTEAINYAVSIFESGDKRGFVDDYRYMVYVGVGSTRISFLDWGRRMETCRGFFVVSLWISLAAFLAVFVLLTLLSGRIVKPMAESYEKQKRFVTDAGHEIKTPLAIIDADSSLLEMETGENQWLCDIKVQVKRLTTLTNDLIYLARMEEEGTSGRLQMIDFPLSDIVEEEVRSFEGLAKKENKNFTSDIKSQLSLHGDEHSIRQLISILLDNAIKYSDDKGEINVKLEKQGRNVQLSVFNTTKDIDKKELPHFFDRFYRGDKSRKFKEGSFGIGLSLASAIISVHKGKIQASSKDGKSLLITVLLPA